MIQTRAMVVAIDGQDALVEAIEGGCGNCSAANGCGSSKVSQLFCSGTRHFRARNGINASVGTFVHIAMPEGVLLQGALLVYGLPLGLMLVLAIVASLAAPAGAEVDAYAAIGGLLGLVAGFVWLRFVSLRKGKKISAQPVIVAVVGNE